MIVAGLLLAASGCGGPLMGRDGTGFLSKVSSTDGVCGEGVAYSGPDWISVTACAQTGKPPGAPATDPESSWLISRFYAPASRAANPANWRVEVFGPDGSLVSKGVLPDVSTYAATGRVSVVAFYAVPKWQRGSYTIKYTSTFDALRAAEIRIKLY